MASFLSILCFFCCYFVFASDGAAASRRVFTFPEFEESSSIASDQYRTAYHFQPPKNWMNDPNGMHSKFTHTRTFHVPSPTEIRKIITASNTKPGPMYYNGVYHLFYQYNPYGALWGNMTWGHSTSTDLINWTPQDPAIYRSKPFDINGCFSGSATILQGSKPVILYTGIDTENRQVQNVAFPKNLSDPFLREWVKPDYNPIMEPVDGIDPGQFRDPTTAWHGSDGHWRVAVGAEIEGNGMAILYKSGDFVHWMRAASPLHTSKGSGMWECPDFYPVLSRGRQGLDTSENSKDVKHVLKMSLGDMYGDHYLLGIYDLDKDIFVPDKMVDDYRVWLRYDYGKFYASKTFFDEKKKRRILWAWLSESDNEADGLLKGWQGIQAIPRTIWLDSSGRQLVQWPVRELEALRRNGIHLHDTELKTGVLFEIKGVKTSQADIEVDFELPNLERAEPLDPSWLIDPPKLCREEDASVKGGLGPFGLLILASHNLEEHTAVFFRVYKAANRYVVLLCSDQRRSSLRPEVDKPAYGSFVDIDIKKEGRISLRTLIDHSVVESFAGGGRTCITARVYPEVLVTGDIHLYAFNNGTEAMKVSKLQAWDMAKPWINVEGEWS